MNGNDEFLQAFQAQAAHDEPAENLWSWSMGEAIPWIRKNLDKDSVVAKLTELHKANPSLFLLRISGGAVELVAKEGHVPEGPLARAELYRKFLQETVSLSPDIDTTIAIYLEDGALNRDDVPIFAFQKIAGGSDLLLPDVDLLRDNFYEQDAAIKDTTAYGRKSCSAVFSGSTSGGHVGLQTISENSHPRLRSAEFFKGNPKVDFRIPIIVQYDSEETVDYLKSLGYGNGDFLSWQEQFQHKFVISMDGNGATCSRIPIILRSRSILLKYTSNHVLYYFSGLKPWLNFIPIISDSDVLSVVAMESASPGAFRYISEEGQRFAEAYLTRYQATRYTTYLLRLYEVALGKIPGDWLHFRACTLGTRAPDAPVGMVLVHIQDRGDARFDLRNWVGSRGSKKAIEGFAIEVQRGESLFELRYQAILGDGALTGWHSAGEYCGTRHMHSSILGICLQTVGLVAADYCCVQFASFVDGSSVGPVEEGEICKSANGAALEAFRLEIRPRA